MWTQQAPKLVGTGAVGGSATSLGYSVAISADGNTAIVGGPDDNNNLGASWVFRRAGGVWTQQGPKLVGTGAVGDYVNQGYSVALSADGNTAIVGGPDDNNNLGAAWVFTSSGGVWTQQGERLVGSHVARASRQGVSVGVSADGNTAIVAGPRDDGGVGAAWVFIRSDGAWTQQGEKLVGAGATKAVTWPPSVDMNMAVALSGDGQTVMLGRWLDGDGTSAAWVFIRSDGAWMQLGDKLVGTGAVGFAGQGRSVALSSDGTTAILGGASDNGGAGAAWVFVRQGGLSALWVPVVAHTDGKNGSQWRSDVGLLNPGTGTANVTLTFHGSDGLVANTTYVPAGAQSVLVDVVAQLGARDQGALEVASDRPLKLTSRTYNQASAGIAYGPGGTTGQSYPVLTAGDGLSEGQSAWLPHLAENAVYRTNIGVVNVGAMEATAKVELYDGAGSLLATYDVTLAPGQWSQKTKPFASMAGQTALDRGYARVTVTSGAGVVAFASVVDNITNDPTTITMQR